jgi:AcrR family transcriptional regulator
MGRLTRAEKQQRTRDALIETAARVFAEYGYDGASIDRIAEAAGYSKGAFYSNFDSKEQLALAVLERTVAADEQRWAAVAAATGGDAGALMAAMIAGLTASNEDRLRLMLRCELLIQAARNPGLATAIRALYQSRRDGWAALLGMLFERFGRRPPADLHLLADILLAAGIGHSLLDNGGAAPEPADALMSLLLNALTGPVPAVA